MKNRELEAILRNVYLDVMNRMDVEKHSFLPAFDPTKKGRKDNGVYFYLTLVKNYAFQDRTYHPVDGHAGHKEVQIFEYNLQITALSTYIKNKPFISAMDLSIDAMVIIQSLDFMAQLADKNISIFRPSSPVQIPYLDEADNNAQEIKFDVRLTVKQERSIRTEAITQIIETTLGV